ncbi:PspC domain-containing protein [Halpernia sp.]|uniref:PspC domain-containing protein n=1 Tax=Halpernia sp. TaxID=2782209 RepID=UPI003A8F4FEC
MNKTLSIGLAGFSFTIEEHAYIKLSDYLAALRNTLDANEADEVMHDIEIRMVEIFKESLGKREVINDEDVERVIAQIGAPEKIEEQEQAYYSENSSAKKEEKSSHFNGQKQLFRDPEKKKIAGVCAGLAQYVGLDITVMRIIWVAVFLIMIPAAGSALLIAFLYGILWLVLPEAESAADFLKMKGKPINFDNLKEESNKIVSFANESSEKVGQFYNANKGNVEYAGSAIWNAFRYILGGIFGLMGIGCLIGSAAIFGSTWFSDSALNLSGNFGFYLEDYNLKYLITGFAFLSTFIPAIIFFLLAIKLISPKTTLKFTGYVIGALVFLWIVLLATIGFSAARYNSQYSGDNEETQNIAINTTSDSLFVDVKKVEISSNFKSYWDNIYSDKKTVFKRDYPSIDVTHKDVSAPYLVIKKNAEGYNIPLKMQVPVEIQNNKILFPNYISYPYSYRLRDYDVNYELVVPKNMKVIALNEERGFSLDDDYDKDDDNSDNSANIKINGTTINIPSDDADSIIINGKKVGKDEAENYVKKVILSPKDLRNIKIDVDKDKAHIDIKTK